jgi:thiamine-phosphate pyrophosphorylase
VRIFPDLSVYLVTDRALCLGRDLMAVVAEAVAGGAGVVQLREKEADTRDFVALARAVREMLDPLGVPLVINDRVDVALAAGAHGVHVGQSDMHPADVRALIGPDMLLGLSIDRWDQLQEAEGLDVDYLGLGPVYATATKADAGEPLGLDGLRRAVDFSSKPVVAIGGIGLENAARVAACDPAGLAVVSAICSAESPRAAAQALVRAMKKI